jgi:hypothetical protein
LTRTPGTVAITRSTSSARSRSSHLQRSGERGDRGSVQRAGADLALLAAAVDDRRNLEVADGEQGAHADRTTELVRGHRHGVQTAGGEIDRQVTDRLHGVAVHGHAGLQCRGDHLVERLDRPDLVVGPHAADERDCARILRQQVAQLVGPDPADLVHVDQPHVEALPGEPLHRVEHRVVLDRGGQDPYACGVGRPARVGDALDSQVVGLGAPGGEHHVAGTSAQAVGDRLAGLLDHPARIPSGRVQARRVAEPAQLLDQDVQDLRQHRGRGGVVEVRARRWGVIEHD